MSASAGDGHTSVRYRKKAVPLALARFLLRRGQMALYCRYVRRFPPRPEQRVLDLGVNASLESRELYFFEANYPYPERVVAAGLESSELFSSLFPEIEYVQLRRGEPLPFADAAFDVIFCNAVVEHVGSRRVQKAFLEEIFRVGKAAFVTTPNRWFPVELHTVLPFVHYLPAAWYRRILHFLGFHFFAEEANLNLLGRRALSALVPDDVDFEIGTLRILGVPSNLILAAGRGETA